MLGMMLPYEPASIEMAQPPVSACEVWFVEELEESPVVVAPAYILPDLASMSADDTVH